MTKALLIVILLSTFIITIISCSKGGNNPPAPVIDCTGATKSWANDVNPLIQTYCNQPSCHDVASSNGPGPLTNYAQVFSARTLIKNQVSAGLMPQNTTLTNAQRTAIVCWINSGAPNN